MQVHFSSEYVEVEVYCTILYHLGGGGRLDVAVYRTFTALPCIVKSQKEAEE